MCARSGIDQEDGDEVLGASTENEILLWNVLQAGELGSGASPCHESKVTRYHVEKRMSSFLEPLD